MKTRNTKSLNKIKDVLARHREEINAKYNVAEIGVFGSYVRAEQGSRSDIDVLVRFSEPIGLFKFMELEEYLRRLLGIKVDLVSKEALKPYIGQRILEEVSYV